MKIFFEPKTLLCCSCSGSLGHPVLLIWQSQFLCLLRKELPFNPESLMYCTKVCLLFVPVSPQNIEQGLSWDWSLRNLWISSFHACTFSFSSVHTNFPRACMVTISQFLFWSSSFWVWWPFAHHQTKCVTEVCVHLPLFSHLENVLSSKRKRTWFVSHFPFFYPLSFRYLPWSRGARLFPAGQKWCPRDCKLAVLLHPAVPLMQCWCL